MNVNMVRNNMEAGMEIIRAGHFDDCVSFTHFFEDKEQFHNFTFRIDFDLQRTFSGGVFFRVYNRDFMHSLLYEKNALEMLPLIEALIETRRMVIRAIYDDASGSTKEFLESVDTFILDDYEIDNLISIRDTVLNIINYGGGFSAISD